MTTPTPFALADQLEQLAKRLRTNGANLAHQADILASRGYPSTASGAGGVGGGGGGDVHLNAVEAAAAHPHAYCGIDEDYARLLAAGWKLATGGILLIDRIVVHADPESSERRVRRPGAGPCLACGCDVPGTAEDRLRSGYCRACYQAWLREDRPERPGFERRRWSEAHPPDTVHVDPTQVVG